MFFCLVCNDELFPVRVGGLLLGCDNFDLVAADKQMVEWNDATVDLCAQAMEADIRVDGKCEIDGRCALGQDF